MNFVFILCFILKLSLSKSEVVNKVFDVSSLPRSVNLSYAKYEPAVLDRRKSPVIILHGILASKKYWKPICEEIVEKTNRTCFALDLREHNESPYTVLFSYKTAVSDLMELFNQQNVDESSKAILLGHSLGGIIASRFATLKPELIEKLIIVDANPDYQIMLKDKLSRFYLIEEFKMYDKAIDLVRKENLNLIDSKLRISEFLKTEYKKNDEQIRGYLSKLTINEFKKVSWKFNTKTLRKFMENMEYMEDFSPAYNQSTMLIYADKSNVFKIKQDIPIVKQLFPNLTLRKVKGDHNLFKTNRVDFMKEVLSFI